MRSPQRRTSAGISSSLSTKWLGSKVIETGTADSTRSAVAASWARVPQQGSKPIFTPSRSPRSQIVSSAFSAVAQASTS